MTFKEIQELIKLIDKSELTEFKLKKEQLEIVIRTKQFTKSEGGALPQGHSIVSIPSGPIAQQVHVPMAPPTAEPNLPPTTHDDLPKVVEEEVSTYKEIRSPIVGTFYRSSSPDKPPFKKVGDMVAEGETVCIVEAMKLFNEIESEISGKIVKVIVEDASPVEYDQVLFLVDPKG